MALNRYSIKEIKDKSHRYQALLDRIPPQGKIKFPTGSGFILVNPSDIIYINADWNYSEIFLTNDNREMITTNLGTIEKSLPTNYFYRVNRSTIINLTYLERVNRKKRTILLVRNGQEYIFTVPLLNIRKLERHLEEKQL